MKRVGFGLALLCLSSSASAGTTVGELIAQSIYETSRAAGEIMTDSKMGTTLTAVNSAAGTLRSNGGGDATNGNWLAVASGALMPAGSSITNGQRSNDGRFTATGVGSFSDTTQIDCSNFTFNTDVQGNLIVPSIRLQGGGPMAMNQWVARMSPGWPDGNSIVRYASSGQALALWYAHKANLGSIDKRYWLGVWQITYPSGRATYAMSSQSYYDTAGNLVPRRVNLDGVSPTENYTYVGAFGEFNQPCPQSTTGGTVHYYLQTSNQCTAYAPNASMGVGGYAYPETATVPAGTWNNTLNWMADSFMACDLNPEFLRKLVNFAWQKAAQTYGYAGYPYREVQTSNLRTGGGQPKVKDALSQATVPTSFSVASSPVSSSATPNPVPTASASPSPSPTASIDTTHPDVAEPSLTVPEFKFWPDSLPVPTIDMSNYTGGTCPTYSGSIFGHQVTLDSHCPLIADHRALIGTLFVFFYGICAALIIMRA